MFCYFNLLKSSRKGQIFPLLIAFVVILIIAALITANIGRVGLERLYSIQGADAGALAGVSDYTSGYNKATVPNLITNAVYIAVQAWLLTPVFDTPCLVCGIPYPCDWCMPKREMVVAAANNFNQRLYDWANSMVWGYSSSVRKDAYYYAFINAGVDDKYKCIPAGSNPYVCSSFRDLPLAGESWKDWTSYKSNFSKWIHDTTSGSGWENAGSHTYTWYDGSKSVTFTCETSLPMEEDLRIRGRRLWSVYCFMLPILYIPCCLPIPGPYHPFTGDFIAGFRNPSTRWARVTVKLNYQTPEKNLGFWKVRHHNIQARARAEMTPGFKYLPDGLIIIGGGIGALLLGIFGDYTNTFDYKLTE